MSTRTETEGRTYEGTAVAIVEFEQGVRSAPPQNQYAAIADFGDGPAWSLGMEFLDDLDEEGWMKMAEVDLLVDDAPHDEMVQGAEFAICEGPIEVGRVRVLVSSDRVPSSSSTDDEDLLRKQAA